MTDDGTGTGTCFEDCAKFALEHKAEEPIVVQGVLFAHNLNRWIWHAWIELQPGTEVRDDTGDREVLTEPTIFDPNELRIEWRLIPKRCASPLRIETGRYTPIQVAKQLVLTRHWGPWDIDDRTIDDIVVAAGKTKTTNPTTERTRT